MSVFGLRASARWQLSLWRLNGARFNSTSAPVADLRKQIMDQIKVAMKNKDTSTSTTLRAVMSDVYNADKSSQDEKINSSAILGILRKAAERRTEAAEKFNAASRGDLAEKELKEAGIISAFLPPTLSENEVDSILSSILDNLHVADTSSPPAKALGVVFKAFYAEVDKSVVNSELVKRRAQALLAARS